MSWNITIFRSKFILWISIGYYFDILVCFILRRLFKNNNKFFNEFILYFSESPNCENIFLSNLFIYLGTNRIRNSPNLHINSNQIFKKKITISTIPPINIQPFSITSITKKNPQNFHTQTALIFPPKPRPYIHFFQIAFRVSAIFSVCRAIRRMVGVCWAGFRPQRAEYQKVGGMP